MPVRAVAGLTTVLVAAGALSAPAAQAPRRGSYEGPGVRLRVMDMRPGGESELDGVRLQRWSGTLPCREGGTERLNLPFVAAIVGPEDGFNGTVTYTDGTRRQSMVGRFTTPTRLTGRVRVRTPDCDTGPVRFRARRTGP